MLRGGLLGPKLGWFMGYQGGALRYVSLPLWGGGTWLACCGFLAGACGLVLGAAGRLAWPQAGVVDGLPGRCPSLR